MSFQLHSNWRATLAGVGVALIVGTTAIPVINFVAPPNPAALRTDSLARTAERFCDPAQVPSFTMTLEQIVNCRDLAAQESMARSTSSLVRLGWVQFFASLIGSAFVVWTVLVARKSMELTRLTLEHQQLVTRKQLRPSFARRPAKLSRNPDGTGVVQIPIANIGQSTARRHQTAAAFAIVVKRSENVSALKPDALRLDPRKTSVSRDGLAGFFLQLSKTELVLLDAGTHALQVGYAAIFDDDLGGKYRFTFATELSGTDLSHHRGLHGVKYVDTALAGRER